MSSPETSVPSADVTRIRQQYKELRLSLGLTLRQAAKLLGVTTVQLSQIEFGPPPKFELDRTQTITAICHRCQEKFSAHPVRSSGEYVPFPAYVCQACYAKEDVE
jgi:transcriptional regulator with XRE-family HTH domain